jgi:excisionase family DNA binding protein
MPALLTITDICRHYNVSRSTVYRLRDRQELPFVHIGRAVRIRREDVDKWYATLTGQANDG